MKILQILISTLFAQVVFSFNRLNIKMIQQNNINEILKYKNVLPETTYNTLLTKIQGHNIEKIYFTSKLDKAIAEESDTKGELFTDYSVTSINPFIIKSIVDESAHNNVETFFLQEPQLSGIDIIASNLLNIGSNYILPFVVFSAFLTFIRNRSSNNSGGFPISILVASKISSGKISFLQYDL